MIQTFLFVTWGWARKWCVGR